MGGEFLREAGILVFVFYGFIVFLSTAHLARLSLTAVGTLVGVLLWLSGVLTERRRSE